MYFMIPHSKPTIIRQDIESVEKVLENGMIASGLMHSEFERLLAEYIGVKNVVAVGSGTVALQLVLLALGTRPGDNIILPTYVCHSVIDAVRSVGAVPIICDISSHWVMIPELVAPLINKNTRAIILVHIFGIAIDATPFIELGVPLIEDCCQAFVANINGINVGNQGAIAIFSFHATKCLTTGEGGAIASNDQGLMKKVRQLLMDNYIASPMSDIQAALGVSQLQRYSEFLVARRKIATKYFKELPDTFTNKIKKMKEKTIFFRFPIQIFDMDFEKVRMNFKSEDIIVCRGVDQLLHRRNGEDDRKYINSVQCFNETLSLPIYPGLNKEQQLKIIRAVIKYCS